MAITGIMISSNQGWCCKETVSTNVTVAATMENENRTELGISSLLIKEICSPPLKTSLEISSLFRFLAFSHRSDCPGRRTRLLRTDGKGSHRVFRYEHLETGTVRVVTVPITHDSIKIGTLREIADQAGARDFDAFCAEFDAWL